MINKKCINLSLNVLKIRRKYTNTPFMKIIPTIDYNSIDYLRLFS